MEDKYLILVNKTHACPENDFQIVKVNSQYKDNVYLEKQTALAFDKLKAFIKSQGYDIEVESGYRSKEYQAKVFEEIEAEKGLEHTLRFVARPGYSEHQTGLAVDFCLKENNRFYIDFEMQDHPVLKLVADNACQFGFIIRYPQGKENITGYGYEPWHLRYVGNFAQEIKNQNITLEEYLEKE